MPSSPLVRLLLSPLILTAVVVFTFAASTGNQFVNWDDQNEITENAHFNPVTLAGLAWNWSNTQLSLYMPVTYMVWGAVAANAQRNSHGQLEPAAFHELNLCLHLICSILVFQLILRLWNRALPALIGALVFAVHPLQVEPVAWASGMYTLLSTAFSLMAIIAYVAYATKRRARALAPSPGTPGEDGGEGDLERPTSFDIPNHPHPGPLPAYRERGSRKYFWLATLFYILALLTKAASVSVPLPAMVIDVLILRRPFRKSFWSLALWMVLGVPIVLVAKHFQDVSVLAVHSAWTRPVVALDATGFYLRKIVLPIHLIADYGRNPTWVIRHPLPVMVSVATAIVALLLAFFARRNAAWVTAGLGLLLAGIGPYLGLTTFDFQYVSTVADRYAYFGMAGVALLAAGAAMRSRWAVAGLLIAVMVWIPMSRKQVERWKDDDALFGYTLAVNSESLVAHNVSGFLAARDGNFAKAETEYRAGLRIWPEDALIHFNLANLCLRRIPKNAAEQQLLLSEAIGHFSVALKTQPGNLDYRNGLAAALALSGRQPEAAVLWKEIIAHDPTYIRAHNNLGDLLSQNGQWDQARAEYNAALRIDPNNPHAAAGLKMISRRPSVPK